TDTVVSYDISARSFYQVNPVQTEVLYRTAMELAGLTKKDRVLDCYCGTGTIGIIASDYCKEVIGVELNQSAVADAVKNADENGCTNISFVCGDSGRFMENMARKGEKCDVVFTDPPRAGSDERFLRCLAKLSPRKVVYISCGIESLERDLTLLKKLGYEAKQIQPVDMFPHTKHVETVVQLSRVSNENRKHNRRNDL
ncbi:MAG: 23S rRNA (uracil(1939)-C(5))-methyltransferase RlmD, partial [Oscillospiraceae bacterium]|nr:23S rRNA (uracil(1939)-C(5))-methyltransferase RlmD [Oscillospiraceae bacterium]